MKKLMTAIVTTTLAGAASALESFSYQGALYSAEGDVIGPANVAIEFRLYDGETAAQALWARKINVRTDKEGYFNAELSDSQGTWVGADGAAVKALGDVLHDVMQREKPLYLGLTVDGSTGEILPRQKLLSVPSAAFATDALESTADAFPVDGTLTVGGASTFNGDVSFGGDVTFNGGATFREEVAIGTSDIRNDQGTVGSCCQMPLYSIVMWWGGDTPPPGWVICNGENGTPNLEGLFPLGGGTGATDHKKGETGGQEKVTLEVQHLPKHTHRFAHDVNLRWSGSEFALPNDEHYGDQNGYRTDKQNALYYYNTTTTGGNQAHDNMPPYFAVHFIMRVN